MRSPFYSAVVLSLVVMGIACAPRQLKPVADIDPLPLLETLVKRRAIFENGVSGTLEVNFRGQKQNFSGRLYLIVFPDGTYRIEIPGPLGGTLLVMAGSPKEVVAYYPGEGKAYRSSSDGRSLNPYIPFPMPVAQKMLPTLFLGLLPDGKSKPDAKAYLMDSGEKHLWTNWNNGELQYVFIFQERSYNKLKEVTASGNKIRMSIRTHLKPYHLPQDFTLTMPEGVLKGEWERASLFKGNMADLELKIPDSVMITDLDTLP